MTNLLSRRWKIVIFILVPLFVTSCLLSTGNPPAPTQTPEGDVGSPADSQEPGVISLQGKMVFGPGDLLFPDTKAGLADLAGYTATLVLSFDGNRAGKTEQWSKTYIMVTQKEPAVRQLTIEKTGDLSDLIPVWMAEAEGATFIRSANNSCTASLIDPENSLGDRTEPAGFLAGVHGAEAAGGETINGVSAQAYIFDERALGLQGIAKSAGEIWVASEGGYIVKYVLSREGTSDYFGEGIEGSFSMEYELTNVNQPVAYELPVDCPAGMINAPQLLDASNIQNVPGLLTYDTSSSVAAAVAFYQAQIPELGWTLLGDPVINATSALVEFTLGDKTITVVITAGDRSTEVLIVQGSS
jgi:hypothetical protein